MDEERKKKGGGGGGLAYKRVHSRAVLSCFVRLRTYSVAIEGTVVIKNQLSHRGVALWNDRDVYLEGPLMRVLVCLVDASEEKRTYWGWDR